MPGQRKSMQRAVYLGTLVETIPKVAAGLAVAGAAISGTFGLVVVSGPGSAGVRLSVPFGTEGIGPLQADGEVGWNLSCCLSVLASLARRSLLRLVVGLIHARHGTLPCFAFHVPATRRSDWSHLVRYHVVLAFDGPPARGAMLRPGRAVSRTWWGDCGPGERGRGARGRGLRAQPGGVLARQRHFSGSVAATTGCEPASRCSPSDRASALAWRCARSTSGTGSRPTSGT